MPEGNRASRLRASRRSLLTGAGAVVGLGIAAELASTSAARAAGASPVPLAPSGDTSGATDYAAIQSILNSGGQETVVLLGSGTFYVNQTITFQAHQQAIRGLGRNITVIEAVAGFSGTSVVYTGSGNQFLTVDGLTIAGPASSPTCMCTTSTAGRSSSTARAATTLARWSRTCSRTTARPCAACRATSAGTAGQRR